MSAPAWEVIHKVNAYTWAGRRAECAVTAEFLPSVQGWEGVTCERCLAARAEYAECPHGWSVVRGDGCPDGPGCNDAEPAARRADRGTR